MGICTQVCTETGWWVKMWLVANWKTLTQTLPPLQIDSSSVFTKSSSKMQILLGPTFLP